VTATTRTERLLLGDWHPWLRDPLDVLRALLVLAATVALARDVDGGSLTLAACAAGGLAVRPLLLPRLYDLMVLVALAVQGFTEASGAYDSLAWIDRVVHFVVPLLGSGVLYVALARLDVLPDPRDDTGTRHLLGIGIVTFALGAALGAVWELVERAADGAFGSSLQEGNDDTVGDLAMDSLGALGGALLLVLWTVKGWGSVRRVPGSTREAHD
jgi:predicted Kef-type K+ transport protein